jgi:hypothetical protein
MRAVLLLTSAAVYWLLFMAAHESGHVIGALVTGGRVTHVVLHPLAISRTDVMPNPHPLVVCWFGPVLGAVIPTIAAGLWRVFGVRGLQWVKGYAGFCLIANGLYLASGVVLPAGDTEDLLRLGAPGWLLAVIGVPLVCAGLWVWHSMGTAFGTVKLTPHQVRAAALRSCIALGCVAGAMLVYSLLS